MQFSQDLFHASRPRSTLWDVTSREKAHAILDHLPEDRVEAVQGRDTSVEVILARHG